MCAEQQQITYVYAYIKAGRKFNNAISLLLSFNMKTELKYIYVTTSFAKWTHKFAEMLLLGSSAPQTPRYQSASGLLTDKAYVFFSELLCVMPQTGPLFR